MGSLGPKPIDTKTKTEPKMSVTNGQKNSTVLEIEPEQEREQEPASPATRLFHTKALSCHILAILGCTTKINRDVIKKGLESTLLNHPRFTSIPVVDAKKGVRKWMKTTVNVEDHIVCPDLDPDMESPDEFLENYTSNLTTIPMDMTKPLWEVHILNVKTSEADAVGILKLHHSIGDGMSIISLVLACTRKASDPEALPTMPSSTKKEKTKAGFCRRFCYYIWFLFMVFWNTAVDAVLFLATILFLNDTETPMKGGAGVEHNPKRLVHRTISLDDMKIVKNALNLTINDVVMGITQAGLSRYLNRRYGNTNGKGSSKTNNLPKNIRLRGSIVFNIRPSTGIKALAEMMEKKSKAKWGNKIGYVLTQFPISLPENPLDYIRQAKTIIDRKKLSLESRFSFAAAQLIQEIFGSKVGAQLTKRVLSHTTVLLSNMVGPQEEITFFGHKLAYAAPTIYGLPHVSKYFIYLLPHMH
ncbi:wax ester synthase/diacylglycerol acyltransferase 11-like isoform X2 [Lycium barbarum]|uniref:wax ester synthase/diacylglycerol acyltransferase 11-like isoform X2 n=1 Tax=Lycium barbarum TaxID=112863 RepID=UPI00293F4F43|nr:wax ester synthase/diacylglycerol acyltransferase 11-like isoform X2 [Lycium barbarum]